MPGNKYDIKLKFIEGEIGEDLYKDIDVFGEITPLTIDLTDVKEQMYISTQLLIMSYQFYQHM